MPLLPEYDAFFFDFDGTLADSYDAIAASVNHLRELRGLGPLPTATIKMHVGLGPEYLLANTVPGGDMAVDWPHYREHHPKVMFELTKLLPGANDLLSELQRAGKKIALCSNKPRLFSSDLLKSLGIAELFDLIVGPEDVPRPKPAPDTTLVALKRLDLRPERVLYVGDMVVDIETARAADVTVWIVPTGSDTFETLSAARPDRLLANLGEILAK